MNQLRTIDTAALAQLSKALVGFDRYFTVPSHQNGNYPPHNIVKYSDTSYAIEVAVAGFTKEEIRHFFNQAHCTILAADAKEGMNRSIPEALSCDVPFLLTRDTLGGVHTLMNPKTGIFVEPSGEAIAQGIRHLQEKREQLSPRAWFTDNFGQEKSNAKLRARIAEVAANSGQMVNIAEMRPYLGDIWSHEYYQHAVGIPKASA